MSDFAKTGDAAIKRALADKPDLILLDVMLPDLSGFDVLTKLKLMDETRNVPVIFITGLTGASDEEKGLSLGAVDYITKPFNDAVVKARVRTHLQIVKHIRTIERLGLVDALTDIPNRRMFDMRMKDEWRRTCRSRSPLSILMIDVDRFKNYNDTYGHPQGDILLQFAARILLGNLRRPSDFAARLGGEEFAVLLADTGADGAAVVAENIRDGIGSAVIPYLNTGEPTSVTVSIGGSSTVPDMGMVMSDFIQLADQNLYIAKENGRNNAVCSNYP